MMTRGFKLAPAAAVIMLLISNAAATDLTELSIEELMNIEVISTARQARPLADAAAAVFVITAEDLRRSGVTSVAEALRMVPGMQVARIDANKWAITARGFNGRFANKLLVLLDGRSLYTPTFSGVYWEEQDLLLDDIERIEVIRGPGASLWGANAVNGVINIVTKHAADTQGGLVSLTAGTEKRAIVGLRYGGQLGQDAFYRVFAKYTERDDLVDGRGEAAGDDWRLQRGGFRTDWAPNARHAFNLQGGLYGGDLDQNLTIPSLTPPFNVVTSDAIKTSGGYVQGRWKFTASPSSQLQLQTYYQREEREERLIREDRDTFDIDFQHRFSWGERQEIVWGLGYRYSQDEFTGTGLYSITPDARDTQLFSAFFQDTISFFDERFELTIGSKLEHNDYTGWELQPNLRVLWAPHPQHRLWAAVSRAVRTPSRGEEDRRSNVAVLPPPTAGDLPSLVIFRGDESFNSEKLTAYELGYRTWPIDTLSVDTVVFYHDYDDLLSIEAEAPFFETTLGGPHITLPGVFTNNSGGQIYGLELAATWRPLARWRLELAYTYLDSDLNLKQGDTIRNRDGTVSQHQVSLRSAQDIRDNLELDLWLRYRDELSGLPVALPSGAVRIDDYLTLDARLGWKPVANLELAIGASNLFDAERLEFVQELHPFPTQVERSVYGQIKWSFD